MKKLTTTLVAGVCLLGAVAASYGQGQLVFQNSTSTEVTYAAGQTGQFAGRDGQNLYGPSGTYMYGLYLGPSGSTTLSNFTLVDTYLNATSAASTSPAAGQIRGGTITGTGNTGGAVGTGTYADFVAVWLAADGTSLSAAEAADPSGFNGMSAFGSITPPASPGTPAQVFGTGAGQLGGFTAIATTPEPGTIALGGLGAAALLFFRRRNK